MQIIHAARADGRAGDAPAVPRTDAQRHLRRCGRGTLHHLRLVQHYTEPCEGQQRARWHGVNLRMAQRPRPAGSKVRGVVHLLPQRLVRGQHNVRLGQLQEPSLSLLLAQLFRAEIIRRLHLGEVLGAGVALLIERHALVQPCVDLQGKLGRVAGNLVPPLLQQRVRRDDERPLQQNTIIGGELQHN